MDRQARFQVTITRGAARWERAAYGRKAGAGLQWPALTGFIGEQPRNPDAKGDTVEQVRILPPLTFKEK